GRLSEAPSKATLVDKKAHVSRAELSRPERCLHPLGHFGFAVETHQSQQPPHFVLQAFSAARDFSQVRRRLLRERRQAIFAPHRLRALATFDKGLGMFWIFDDSPTLEAS